MKALVTGSAGFLGRHFAAGLASRGWDVLGVDVVDGHDAFRMFRGDGWRGDLVVHAAARAPHRAAIDGSPEAAAYNALLDAAMFQWAVETGQRHVLYLSSSAVYSDIAGSSWRPLCEDKGHRWEPFDRYGMVKRHGEQLAEVARDCGVGVTVVRPFSGYGSDQSTDFPFGAFVARARAREDPFTIWGSATQARDFVHVDDIVGAGLTLAAAGVPGPVNICTGVPTRLGELADLVCSAAGYTPRVEVDEAAPMGVNYRIGDPSLLHRWYVPQVTLADGVRRALRDPIAAAPQ